MSTRQSSSILIPLSSIDQSSRRVARSYRKRLACIRSKSVILILAVNTIVLLVYTLLLALAIVIPFSQHTIGKFTTATGVMVAFYSVLAFILLFYPLGGLLADVYCGRYRCIAISLSIIWCGFAIQCTGILVWAAYEEYLHSHIAIAVLMLVCFFVGFSGFQSNVVQFGLDQLLEAPTEKLSIFLHWFVWTGSVAQWSLHLILVVANCCYTTQNKSLALGAAYFPQLTIILFSVLISLGYYKQGWFHMEPGRSNPYRMVFSVLNFARKHNYPLQRSAFTYAEDEKPSRIDFAKTKYGGPFTTEQVEDVKTFLRILALLMCIGPIFTAEVGAGYIFAMFGFHTGPKSTIGEPETACSARWMLLQSNLLSPLITVIGIPVYVFVFFPLFQRKLPTILSRLHFGIAVTVAGLASMLLLDTVGHYTADSNSCLFRDLSFLNIPSAWLIIPIVLNGLGPQLVYITTLEFIAAQSPHTMKGLLFGVFYAVKGLFLLLGTGTLLIFVLGYPDFAAMSCCTGYYLLTTVIVSTGLVVFGIAVRRYKYRQREEPPYSHIPVENYFEHCGEHRDIEGSQEEEQHLHNQHLGNAEFEYHTVIPNT